MNYLRSFILFVLGMTLLTSSFAGDFVYTMRPGDSVWLISQHMLKNPGLYQRLAEHNQIANPLAMIPGQRLKIPAHWLKTEPAAATVLAMSGKVRMERPDESPRDVHLNEALKANDTLITAADSSALLAFADGSRLQIDPDSTVSLDRLTAYGNQGMVDTSLRLTQGSVESRVSKRQSPSLKFDIHTPISLASVRGTDYRVAYTETEHSGRAEVVTGNVQVSNALGKVQVPARTGSVSQQNQAPSPAIPLLPAMELKPVSTLIEYLPPTLRLNPVAGAERYEVQVSQDEKFTAIMAQKVFEQPVWRISDLADGQYWLRIRAIDSHGLRGMDAVHAITVAARPEPPLPMTPKPKGIVRGTEANLHWTESAVAKRYHLRLAKVGGSASTLFDNPLETTQYTARDLGEGDYQWQVASIDASGKHGPFSELQMFQLRPAPATEPPAIDGDVLELRWRAVDGDVSYVWQFAHDKDFNDILDQGETKTANLTLPRPEGGEYYLRIAVKDDPKETPPFGAAQKIEVPSDWSGLLLFGGMAAIILLL
jgi:hypothetical protein